MLRTKLAFSNRSFCNRVHCDGILLFGLLVLMVVGLFTIYSAGGQDIGLIQRQLTRLALALGVMLVVAQIPPMAYQKLSVYFYVIGIAMLVAVLVVGVSSKGAQRWLDLGVFRFQPSEVMKLAVPMMVAWYISRFNLPPKTWHILVGFSLVALPTLLIARQPDLGTSLLIACSGVFALFLAGMSWRFISFVVIAMSAFAPIMWNF